MGLLGAGLAAGAVGGSGLRLGLESAALVVGAVVLVHEAAEVAVIANGIRAGRAQPLTAAPGRAEELLLPGTRR